MLPVGVLNLPTIELLWKLGGVAVVYNLYHCQLLETSRMVKYCALIVRQAQLFGVIETKAG